MGKDKTPRVFDFYQLEDRILLSGEGLEGADAAPDVDADLSASLLAEMSADGQATDNAAAAAALITPASDVRRSRFGRQISLTHPSSIPPCHWKLSLWTPVWKTPTP